MKHFLALLLIPTALTGCFKAEPTSTVATVDRVYTVNEFLAEPNLRKKISAACNNDPGRIGHDPNCMNSRRADRIASAGSAAAMPSIIP